MVTLTSREDKTMKSRQLMEAIFKNRGLVHELMLTERQVIIVRLVRDRGSITSRWFSSYQKISIQNASAQLIKLYLKGYLHKEQITSKTGGLENVYRSAL